MLTLDKVELRLGDFRLTANWQVAAGARLALIGPSGAGKSSLLAAIAGFFPPTSGRIAWAGTDLSPLPPGERPLTILFQDQNLFPHLTVAQNVGLGLRPDLRLSVAQQNAVIDSLHRVGLDGLATRKPGQLSGGQAGRVALARALLRARPLLLLDEPFAALGPALKAEMLELLDTVATATGATVMMVTHDPADALRLGGQTVLVADGIAQPPVPTEEIFANPPPAFRAYLGTK